jgi:CBS domain-containing protein
MSHVKHLPIARVSLIGAGGTAERALVQCPRVASTVSLGQCLACEHCQTVYPDQRSVLGAIVCDGEADQGPPCTLSLPRLDVAHLMARDVLCVRPSLSLDAAVALFLEHHARSLPVVDEQNQLVGMLHEPDLQLMIQTGADAEATVMSVMLPVALAIPESTAVTRAAAIMAFEGVSSLVVLSPSGDVVGMLWASDLLFWLAQSDGYLTRVRRSDIP